jgi:hypothetical protein
MRRDSPLLGEVMYGLQEKGSITCSLLLITLLSSSPVGCITALALPAGVAARSSRGRV